VGSNDLSDSEEPSEPNPPVLPSQTARSDPTQPRTKHTPPPTLRGSGSSPSTARAALAFAQIRTSASNVFFSWSASPSPARRRGFVRALRGAAPAARSHPPHSPSLRRVDQAGPAGFRCPSLPSTPVCEGSFAPRRQRRDERACSRSISGGIS